MRAWPTEDETTQLKQVERELAKEVVQTDDYVFVWVKMS
jgi:hypothetical protein